MSSQDNVKKSHYALATVEYRQLGNAEKAMKLVEKSCKESEKCKSKQ
jgi:hypothetical protein